MAIVKFSKHLEIRQLSSLYFFVHSRHMWWHNKGNERHILQSEFPSQLSTIEELRVASAC